MTTETSSSSQWTMKIKSPEWFYFRVQLLSDNSDFENTTLDPVSWKMLITSALKKFHGLIGESIEYDILQNSGNIAVVRVHTDDKPIFVTSLIGFTTSLSMIGMNGSEGYIRILDRSQYLSGVVGPPRFPEYIQ